MICRRLSKSYSQSSVRLLSRHTCISPFEKGEQAPKESKIVFLRQCPSRYYYEQLRIKRYLFVVEGIAGSVSNGMDFIVGSVF